jgi:uncharacterized membrane protein YdbT with pleckstrin-like domain
LERLRGVRLRGLGQFMWAFLVFPLLLDWLRSVTTTIEITTQRIRFESGILSKVKNDLELFRIDDVTYEQPLGMRLLGYGQLRLRTTDRSTPTVILHGIKGLDRMGRANSGIRVR